MKHRPPPCATKQSRKLRKDMTDAEQMLWRMLRESSANHYFRRQVPIRNFITDSCSHRAKVMIEVDGGQHEELVDADRTSIIEAEGYRVIRFWNNDVLGNQDGVWSVIASVLHGDHPHPTLPHQGGGL